MKFDVPTVVMGKLFENGYEDQIIEQLDGIIYKEPTISKERGEDFWVVADEYLSGNVREKLKQAELLNENGSLDKNIEALKAVQPEELTVDDIDIFGYPDCFKLQSSMTLFAVADPSTSVFQDVLEKFYEGKSDENTLKLLKKM